MQDPPTHRFVLCVASSPDNVDLVIGKVYRLLDPHRNDLPGQRRVIDDSGEDYLYPVEWFVPIDVPAEAERALAAAGEFEPC